MLWPINPASGNGGPALALPTETTRIVRAITITIDQQAQTSVMKGAVVSEATGFLQVHLLWPHSFHFICHFETLIQELMMAEPMMEGQNKLK